MLHDVLSYVILIYEYNLKSNAICCLITYHNHQFIIVTTGTEDKFINSLCAASMQLENATKMWTSENLRPQFHELYSLNPYTYLRNALRVFDR